MATYQILYWHDLPLQVRARDAGGRVSVQLPERFQQAVDQAAMAAGLTGADDYTDGLRWDATQERLGDAREVAAAVSTELDALYASLDWRKTVEALRGKA